MNEALQMIANYRLCGLTRYKLAIIRATYGKVASDLARDAIQIKTPGLRRAVQQIIASAIINADDTMADGSLIEWEADNIANPWAHVFICSLQTDSGEREWDRAYKWFHTRKAM